MTAPVRIQRRRTSGWRMPKGAVYVGRPTVFGNPAVVEAHRGGWSVWAGDAGPLIDTADTQAEARAIAVAFYATWLESPGGVIRRHDAPNGLSWAYVENHEDLLGRLLDLRGRDLACWCPLDQPCHADVLLELANRRPS